MLEAFASIPIFFWVVILTALAFDLANGWHDTANAVATAISTRVLRPSTAILLSATLNFIGAMLSTKVAKTIGGGIINPEAVQNFTGSYVIFAALIGAISWEIYTVLKGLPVSGSHALIGGLIGAAVSLFGFKVVISSGVTKIFLAMLISPLLGMTLGFIMLKISYFFAARMKPLQVKRGFSALQIFTASTMSLMHGQNDAQKVMGVITLLLFAGGFYGATEFSQVHVPVWSCWPAPHPWRSEPPWAAGRSLKHWDAGYHTCDPSKALRPNFQPRSCLRPRLRLACRSALLTPSRAASSAWAPPSA